MEKQVVLSLKEFEELSMFKEKIKNNHTVKIVNHNYFTNNPIESYISSDEAVKEIGELNELLAKEVTDLHEANWKLRHDKHQPEKFNGKTAADVSQMSIWEFLKWKVI